jgi:environmental stress-induced protein Ves
MSISWFDHSVFRKQPWKNGQGETLELYRIVDPHSPKDFLFRLSIAKVLSSGPFSIFSGIDRHLILLTGDGLRLKRENGDVTILSQFKIISFTGEEKMTCDITSSCMDFNVMTKRGWKTAQVEVIHLPKKGTIHLIKDSFLYQVSGDLRYQSEIRSKETLWKIDERIEIESITDSTSILIKLI